MTELKLCAFCGSANVVAIEPAAGYPSSDLFKYSYVHCDDCHADGPPDLGKSGAIERYNTRPVEDKLRAENERLRAALAWYADDNNYREEYYEDERCEDSMVMVDRGERARDALEGGVE